MQQLEEWDRNAVEVRERERESFGVEERRGNAMEEEAKVRLARWRRRRASRQAGAVNERASERGTSPTATAPTPTVAVVLAPLKRTTPLGAAVRSGPRTGPQPRPHHAMEAESVAWRE